MVGKDGATDGVSRKGQAPVGSGKRVVIDRYIVLCAVAFSVTFASGSVVNALVYSRVAEYYGFAREIATAFGGCVFLVALLIARFKPELMFVRRISVTFCVLCVVMVPLLSYGLDAGDSVVTVIALCIRAASRAWALTLIVAVLVRAKSLSAVPLAVAFGWVASAAAKPLLLSLNTSFSAAVALSVTTILVIALLTAPALPVLDKVRNGLPADLVELLHPRAFLGLSNGFFFCTFLFAAASGFGMTFREVENAPVQTSLLAFVVLFCVVYTFVVRGERQEDALFSFSVVLVMAGFLLAPAASVLGSDSANVLLDIGEDCFEVLMWLMFASIGRRNLFAMLPVFGFAEFCKSMGTDVGAASGHLANVLAYGNEGTVQLFALGFAFVLFVFLWVGFRSFSFTKVVHDVEPLGVPSDIQGASVAGDGDTVVAEGVMRSGLGFDGAAEPAGASLPDAGQAPSMDERCRLLSEAHGLTAREQEVFAMLAHGRNARFIMDQLVLSRNTVKGHIKHIYTKLDVHSQQELIDLVEAA